MSFAWSSKMRMLWEQENESLMKTSLFNSVSEMPCWEAALSFSSTQKPLCLTDRTGDKKRYTASSFPIFTWVGDLNYKVWRIWHLANLNLAQAFFNSSIISLEKCEKRNIFPVTQHINNICTLNEFETLLEWETEICRDWAVWLHCKEAGRDPVAGLALR